MDEPEEVMTPTELADWARAIKDQHDPLKQVTRWLDRCELCGFTRHPCDTYGLAETVLRLLGEKQ